MKWNEVGDGEDRIVTVFDPSYTRPQAMHCSHPGYDSVIEQLEAGDLPAESAFNPAERAREAFLELGDRVSVREGQVYLDGDPIDNSCTKAILRWMEYDEQDWVPLVRFFEKVQGNPSENSRNQLYSFLAANDYTLTRRGDIVGYKAVRRRADGQFESIHGGQPGDVQVNGEDAPAKPIQGPGDVVTMARSAVNPDEFAHCSHGLHVAAWSYANGWFGGSSSPVLRVIVSPTDVVSVPNDHDAQKMRVCRYAIDAVIDAPDERALFTRVGEVELDEDPSPYVELEEEEEENIEWGRQSWDPLAVKFVRTGENRAAMEGEMYLNPYYNLDSNGLFLLGRGPSFGAREIVKLV